MDEKKTMALMVEISKTSELDLYLKNNEQYMNAPSNISKYLNDIIEKRGLKKSKIIQESGLNKQYFYEILTGKKGKDFKQNTVLAIAIAMGLSLDETQRLLKLCKAGELYPKRKRDSIIIWGINQSKSLTDIDIMLFDKNEETIKSK